MNRVTQFLGAFAYCLLINTVVVADSTIDLTEAKIFVRGENAPELEKTAAVVLGQEIKKRTGIDWALVSGDWPANGPVVVVTSGQDAMIANRGVPKHLLQDTVEGYGIETEPSSRGDVVWVVGADAKGTLNGVGRLLRAIEWRPGSAKLSRELDEVSAPRLAIRGHQLGYRTTANSYDAWDVATYDQFIRELALFGSNAIENIPFQDSGSQHMPISREEMNREMSKICQRYGMAYWVWTPATVDLSNPKLRAALLKKHEEFYQDCPQLDAVFFPGGDPGHNPPQLVLPFLEDVSKLLAKHHPEAGIWMSLQGFDEKDVDYFFEWITKHQPDWFTGAVGGPSSPPLGQMRLRLPKKYKLRDYPDITHTVRSQFPTVWIDPAIAFTSGREGPNPEPIYYRTIQRLAAEHTDGFITYSDGIHDDVNKIVSNAIGWNPEADVRTALVEYCRFYFGPEVAEQAADGIFSLERNWSGPLSTNGGVEATLGLWLRLDKKSPQLKDNWRWQLCQLKANYDAYIRARLLAETQYEQQANAALLKAKTIGVDQAIVAALDALGQADTRVAPRLRTRVFELCARMFKSIGYQTHVEMYGANAPQRGAVLNFVDHPLNNRWWLEDELEKVRALTSRQDQLARLHELATWEHPGAGSFYDDIGNVSKSEHVLRGEWINTDPLMLKSPNPDYMWWQSGMTRLRPSWVSKMDWPIGLQYMGVDPVAAYTVKTTGYGQCLLRVNGERVQPTTDGREIGDIKEFPIPNKLYQNGVIKLTFDLPHEPGVNWRKVSRLSEVWLIKE